MLGVDIVLMALCWCSKCSISSFLLSHRATMVSFTPSCWHCDVSVSRVSSVRPATCVVVEIIARVVLASHVASKSSFGKYVCDIEKHGLHHFVLSVERRRCVGSSCCDTYWHISMSFHSFLMCIVPDRLQSGNLSCASLPVCCVDCFQPPSFFCDLKFDSRSAW